MNIGTKKLNVEIFNDQYSLISDENEQNILKSAQMVDKLMKEIAEKTGISDAKKIAVLVALKIANKLVSLENDLKNHDKKQEQLVDRINKEGLSSCLKKYSCSV